MAASSASSGPQDSFALWLELPSPDSLLEELTQITAQADALQARRQQILDSLDLLVEAGEAAEEMDWNDYKVTRRTRRSYTYPEHLTEQREALKAAERLSIALGEATLNLSTHWEIRRPKP